MLDNSILCRPLNVMYPEVLTVTERVILTENNFSGQL